MTADESLARFGLMAPPEALPVIRQMFTTEAAKERAEQGTGDVDLIRLCCVQLFAAGQLDDALLVWTAQGASFDLACGIDVQLL